MKPWSTSVLSSFDGRHDAVRAGGPRRVGLRRLRFEPQAATANLERLADDFPDLHGRWGFRDSVNVQSGHVSGAYLSLDQGMIMAALGNALGDDVLRRAFADASLERALRPVIGVERFSTRR